MLVQRIYGLLLDHPEGMTVSEIHDQFRDGWLETDAPDLPRLLDPHEPKRVVVTCPNPDNRDDCKGTRYYRPGDLKAILNRSPGNSADIDWDAGDAGVGSYLCGVCAPGATVQQNLAEFHRDKSKHYVSKKDGTGGWDSTNVLFRTTGVPFLVSSTIHTPFAGFSNSMAISTYPHRGAVPSGRCRQPNLSFEHHLPGHEY